MHSTLKYKDCSPLETVNRIRGILCEHGILTTELWTAVVEGYYTVKIEIAGTNLHTVGKGANQVFALASGYGELMERIQNFAFSKYSFYLCDKSNCYGGFVYAPDEKQVHINDLLESKEKCINAFTSEAKDNEERYNILKDWNSIETNNNNNKPDNFIAIPYLKLNDGKIVYIPSNMICQRYGTNGMSAGNTREEALVQGISEVIERHVTSEIIRKNIVPPTIPEDYLKKYPHLYEMIKRLERFGNFQLIIKDCSLGKGYPVTGAILLDKNTHRYFVKFGCHPVFVIALERTLTELLQGKDFNESSWMRSFSYLVNLDNEWDNAMRIIYDGIGYYRPEFFSDSFSYEFTEFKDLSGFTNKEMLQYLTGIIKGKGYDILIRDVSFLGFPAFQVIVPFFSEISYPSNKVAISVVKNNRNDMRISRNLNNASDEELNHIIRCINTSFYTNKDSIAKFINLPVKETFPYKVLKRDKFVCAAFYKTGDYEKAYKAIDRYIQEFDSGKKDPGLSYFKCLRDYIGARCRGIENKYYIKGILGKFYTEDIVEKVMSGMKNPDDTFKSLGELNCYRCDVCNLRSHCWYPSIKMFHMKFKDVYALNIINQERNTDLCDC